MSSAEDIQAEISRLQEELEAKKVEERDAALERFARGTEVFIRAEVTHGPDDDGDVPAMYVIYDGRAGFSFFKPDRVSPVSDWISRAEHDRLIAEAKVGRNLIDETPLVAVDVLATSAARACESIQTFSTTALGHSYLVTVERTDDTPCTCDPAKGEACSDCRPVTPVAPKLTAGDCVDYLIKEYALDTGHQSEPKLRSYCRDRDGVKYTVSVCRTADFEPNAPVVVAPVGVVEELREAYSECHWRTKKAAEARLDAVLEKLVTLPEPDKWGLEWNTYLTVRDAEISGMSSILVTPRYGSTIGLSKQTALEFAAALIAAAQEGK